MSYVRNLGFEDTPDYDYLRELFTQALKNTGEVEDGEYDWMKLNNGRGWEALKHHPSQHLHAANAPLNPSTRPLAGGAETPRPPGTPGIGHLNVAQPLPQSPAKPGVGKDARAAKRRRCSATEASERSCRGAHRSWDAGREYSGAISAVDDQPGKPQSKDYGQSSDEPGRLTKW